MRSIGPGLRAYIAALPFMSGIAVFASGRIDQSTPMPAVSIHRQSSDANDCLDAHNDALMTEQFVVLAWAETDEQALSLSSQLADAVDDYVGAMGTGRIAQAVYIEDESADFDPVEYGDESGRFVHPLSLLIMHSPA